MLIILCSSIYIRLLFIIQYIVLEFGNICLNKLNWNKINYKSIETEKERIRNGEFVMFFKQIGNKKKKTCRKNQENSKDFELFDGFRIAL